MEIMLALALTRDRTATSFVYLYFCNIHNRPVDKKHIDECQCLNHDYYKVTQILNPVKDLGKIYDCDAEKLAIVK